MKKIIDELINSSISGVDVYRYKNATWLIFTDETRWVVELTDEGTLWYNYKFFNDVFKYVSMTVGKEMEEYVIQWANEHFFKVSALRSIANNPEKDRCETEKVLENGIKETKGSDLEIEWHTREVMNDGVKEVRDSLSYRVQNRAENLTWRIVKDVKPNVVFHGINNSSMSFVTCNGNNTEISKIVEQGIKNIYPDQNSGDDGYNWSDEFEAGKVIEYGVKL
jgi:hypothetical protein